MTERIQQPLTLELARNNPELYKELLVGRLREKTVYGEDYWNFSTISESSSLRKMTINPSGWVSHSNRDGRITIGAAPMPETTRDKLTFQHQRFSYADEVTYRLLHEVSHGVLFLAQDVEQVQHLLTIVSNARQVSGHTKGVTSLGSLEFYSASVKPVEDTTELLTMYAWNPSYLREFLTFLQNPLYKEERERVGLVKIKNADHVFNLVETAAQPIIQGIRNYNKTAANS